MARQQTKRIANHCSRKKKKVQKSTIIYRARCERYSDTPLLRNSKSRVVRQGDGTWEKSVAMTSCTVRAAIIRTSKRAVLKKSVV